EEIQQALLNKQITERHARTLIKLKEPEKQVKLVQDIIEERLNGKQTEERVEKMNKPKEKKKRRTVKGENKDNRSAMNTIKQSLSMVCDAGVQVESDEKDHDDYYQITIKIPKKK